MQLEDITLEEALDRLEGLSNNLADLVLKGKVVFWIGSGFSRTRVPMLSDLLKELLTFLQAQIIAPDDPKDPARKALKAILESTSYSIDTINLNYEPNSWEHLDQIISQLEKNYSKAFGVLYNPHGTQVDLVWDILKVPEKYGDEDLKPDAEHRLLALLVEEGIAPSLLTTNWDPLIEKAHQQVCGETSKQIHVIACPEEVNDQSLGGPLLLKIHGCAQKTLKNATVYRDSLIATYYQICAWENEEYYRPLRTAMGQMVQSHTVFYIGLSGGDYNIQASHFKNTVGRLNGMNHTPPQVIFAEGDINESRRTVLECAYSNDYYKVNCDQIDHEAIVPMFAKPLLGALYVRTILEKLRSFINSAPQSFKEVYSALCEEGLIAVEGLLKKRYDSSIDSAARRWRMVSEELACLVTSSLDIYRYGRVTEKYWAYHPLSRRHLGQAQDGYKEYYLTLIVSILSTGWSRGYWKIKITPSDAEQCRIYSATGEEIPLFVISDISLSDPLFYNVLDSEQEALVLYVDSAEPKKPRVRSPKRRLPHSSMREQIHNIWLLDTILEGEDILEYLRTALADLALIELN